MTPESRIEGIWAGHVQGTNRGKILVRVKRYEKGLTAKAMLYDEQLGVTPRGMLRLRTPTQWYKNHVSKDRPGMGRVSRPDPTLYAENEFA